MKKAFLVVIIILITFSGFAQSKTDKVAETTIKRFSFGADIFTDIWMNQPEGVKVRTINQGVNVFGMYNYPIGESNFSFAFGFGFGFHNMYSNSRIKDIKADSIEFVKIPDSISYKKSKLGLSYFDVPIEFRLKTKDKVRFAIGFKVGYLIDAKTKYKGNRIDGKQWIEKHKQVDHVEKWRFGPTIRVGFHWFNIFAFYSVTHIFKPGRGPDKLYPISVGITLLPF
jgi:hypothetical protein